MIKAVIFDMDGLLIDSEPLWFKAFTKAFTPLGITPTSDDWVHHQGRRIDEAVEYYHRTYGWGEEPTQEQLQSEIMSDMVELINAEGKLLPGVQQTLALCRQAGLPMAIASSSRQDVIDAVVATLKLAPYFDAIISAQHEEFGKPHPGVFISAAKKLGVDPRDCVVFEDAPSGVLAAKAARMKCIAVPEPGHKEHSFVGTADIVLDSLEELTETMLESL